MEGKLYKSPAGETGDRGAVIGRIVAAIIWLLAIILTLAIIWTLTHPDLALLTRYEKNPLLFATVVIVGGAAPVVGLVVIGIGSWRRSWRVTVLGLIAAVGPTVFFLAWHAVRRYIS